METTSLGLRQDDTRDLETEDGRTSSRATAPETERTSATTDSWSAARVAPAAPARCGSTRKPDAALGERTADGAHQAADRHRPGPASQICRCPDRVSGQVHQSSPSEWHSGSGETRAVRGPYRDRVRRCDTNGR